MTKAKIVTVMNMKGGVGKTTTTAHIGWILSRVCENPLNVLMIDYDPQFNLSQMYIEEKKYFSLDEENKTIYSVLVDDDDDINPYIIQSLTENNPPKVDNISHHIKKNNQNDKNLHIVPSSLSMIYLALNSGIIRYSSIESRFKEFINEAKSKYDIILIDCHPAGSIFTKTALFNSDYVLIPVVPSYHSARGIRLMMEFLKYTEKSGYSVDPIIIFNGTQKTQSEEEIMIRTNDRYSKYCLESNIEYSKLFKRPTESKSFFWEAPEREVTNTEKQLALENLKSAVDSLRIRIGI
ncbi:ParA family protein [Gluconobacter kondonii]|uniref:ParA family protein n=1 Tax=Gluconobacter kondonii TaxID=941463 RepID=UPI00197E47BE|nr:ParA family protein [Gluconobacter kondonii]MBN3868522.1 ParA family protein [Gluconobacter kondonii]